MSSVNSTSVSFRSEHARIDNTRNSKKADVILLDNMDIETMRRAVTVIRAQAPQILTEASGNIDPNAEQLGAVAATGVDFISLGALTHSAPRFDATLELL